MKNYTEMTTKEWKVRSLDTGAYQCTVYGETEEEAREELRSWKGWNPDEFWFEPIEK